MGRISAFLFWPGEARKGAQGQGLGPGSVVSPVNSAGSVRLGPVVPGAVWRPLREFHLFTGFTCFHIEVRRSGRPGPDRPATARTQASRNARTHGRRNRPAATWQTFQRPEAVVHPRRAANGPCRLSSHHLEHVEHGAEQGEGEAACRYPEPCDLDPCRFAAAFFSHPRPPAPSNWVTIIVVGADTFGQPATATRPPCTGYPPPVRDWISYL